MNCKIWLFGIGFFLVIDNAVQSQSSEPVEIIHADFFRVKKESGQNIKILKGKVRIKQGTVDIRCDSMLEFMQPKMMKMYRKIKVKYDEKTTIHSDYLEYYPNEGKAFFKNNVQLFKEDFTLKTNSAEYDKKSDIFIYDRPGKFTQQKTILYSDKGHYNGKTKMSYFYGNVDVKQEQSTITTDSLQYDGIKNVMILIAPSTVKDSNRTLLASQGYINNSDTSGVTFLYNRPRMFDEEYDAIADTIYYFKRDRILFLNGKASIFDLANRVKILGDSIFVNRHTEAFFAGENPMVFSYRNEDDPFVLRADSIYSSKYINDTNAANTFTPNLKFKKVNSSLSVKQDTLLDSSIKREEIFMQDSTASTKTNQKESKALQVKAASLPYYTSKDRYFVAYNNVRAYSDTIQLYCDSLYFSTTDSLIRLMDNPIMWVNDNQMSGDSIYIHLANRDMDIIYIPANGLIVKQEFDTLYNQARAGSITYYSNQKFNLKDSAILKKNVKMAYFVTDSAEYYVSFDKASSEDAVIYMTEKKKLGRVKFYRNYKGEHYPPNKIPREVLYLDDFVNYSAVRPTSVTYVETYSDTMNLLRAKQKANPTNTKKKKKPQVEMLPKKESMNKNTGRKSLPIYKEIFDAFVGKNGYAIYFTSIASPNAKRRYLSFTALMYASLISSSPTKEIAAI